MTDDSGGTPSEHPAGTGESPEPGSAAGKSSGVPPVVPVGALEFAEMARRVCDALRARGLQSPAFRSPPTAGVPINVMRTLRRDEGGGIVAVRLRGRDRGDVLRDIVEGAVLYATHEVDTALVEELTLVVDPPERAPEPMPSWGEEEPF